MKEKIVSQEITQELRQAYLDYAMSVIVSRALPDARDGLKPVQRRILYTMKELGLTHNAKFRKSAAIVGECFIKDTLILTNKGLIPIQEIKIGDIVYTQSGLRKVVQLYEMPPKPLLEVVLENGVSNVVTPSQKFKVLTPNWEFEWKEAKDLTNNDYLVIKADYPEISDLVKLKRVKENQPQYLNENIAYLLGILISDGAICEDYGSRKLPRLVFTTGNEKEIAERIVSIFSKEFNYTPTIEINNYKYQSKNGEVLNNTKYIIRICRKDINDFFILNFSLKGWRAPTKKIPVQIFYSPSRVIFSFISGLIDGDGWVSNKKARIQYGSVSKNLIDGLLILLLHHGIFCSKYTLKTKNGGEINGRVVKSRHQAYSLEIRGRNAVELAKYLDLASNKKKLRIQKIIESEKYRRDCGFQYDIIPYAGRILFRELTKNHLGGGWYQDINGNKFRMGIKHPAGCKIRYSADLWFKPLRKTQVIDWGIKEKLNRIGSSFFEFLNHITENKIYFIKVKCVRKALPQKTYDLEVENDHEFIANGMVSHNCLGKYHPHGDQAVYDALVRMAQDFSLRYPLVWGQGNMGSVDGDPPAQMRYCLTEDSLVVTNRCLEKISEIANQEDIQDLNLKVLSFDQKINEVSKWFDSGIHPVIEIKTYRGYSLKGTPNHPILVLEKNINGRPIFVWKTLEEIKINDYAVIDRSANILWPKTNPDLKNFYPSNFSSKIQIHKLPTKLTPDLAFLLGLLVSEGCLTENPKKHYRKICLSIGDHDIFAKIKKILKKNFPGLNVYYLKRKPVGWTKKPYYFIEICSSYVIQFFENLGFKKCSASQKTVPKVIFDTNKKACGAFLRGLFEGDGSIFGLNHQNPEIRLVSKSEKLLKEVQILLLRFGIASFLRFDRNKNYHLLTIRSQKELGFFAKYINFESKEKKKKLNEILKNIKGTAIPKSDFIPFLSDYLRNKYRKQKIAWIYKEWLVKHNLDRYFKLKKYLPVLQKFLDKEDKELIKLLLKNNYLFDKIISKKQAGYERVYSLKVESKCHSFVANGFINHNTEAKLTKIAEEMLVDIDKETVDFRPNYDNTREEPVVLPAKIPNLIINGSLGIAVGMATSIPPHNLTEVMSAIKFLIKKPNADISEILEYIKGPDFPTGGTIYGGEKLKQIYAEGKGGITLAGDVLIEKTRKERLIITSIPWQVNKAELVKEIANLALEKVLPDIKDVRDESSREGVRIVIETRPGANLEKLKENLYRLTSLSKTFYFNLIALENGIQPKLFSLKELLLSWIQHRREVIKRRTKFDLEKNKERVHLLEGFDKALENLDRVINIIKRSKDRQEALKNLMEKFKLTQKQADAILEMPLRTLTQMERHKILEELKERRSIIKELEEILRSTKKIDEIIIRETDEIIKNYPTERLTKIVSEEKVFETKTITPEEKVWLIIDQKNLVSLTPIDKFNLDKILKNQNLPKILKPVSTRDKLILVSKLGKVYNVPIANFYHSAKYLESQIILDKNDEILEIMIEEKAKYLLLIFDNGFGKKMKLEDCLTNRKSGISIAKNEVVSVFLINGGETIGTLSESGNILLFKENLPIQGRSAKGVKVMKVKNEKIIKAFLKESNNLLLIFDQGFYKKIDLQEIKVQNRGTKGVKLYDNKYGHLLLAKTIKEEKEIVISDDKLKRVEIKKLPTLKRTQSAKKIDDINLINSILLI